VGVTSAFTMPSLSLPGERQTRSTCLTGELMAPPADWIRSRRSRILLRCQALARKSGLMTFWLLVWT